MLEYDTISQFLYPNFMRVFDQPKFQSGLGSIHIEMFSRVLGFQNIQVCVVWILGLKVMTILVQLRKSCTPLP